MRRIHLRTESRALRRQEWAVVGTLLMSMVGVSMVGAVGASAAAPGATHDDLTQAKAELRALDVRLSILAQRYHGAVVSLRRLQREAGSARREVARARAVRARAQADLDLRARRAYEGGTARGMAAVLGFRSISDLSAGLEFLSALGQADAAVARRADVARVSGGLAFSEPAAGFPLSISWALTRSCFTTSAASLCAHRS